MLRTPWLDHGSFAGVWLATEIYRHNHPSVTRKGVFCVKKVRIYVVQLVLGDILCVYREITTM